MAYNGLQWCARQNGPIEGDGRTPMNDRDMGKQRKSVFFLVMRLLNLISTISICFYKRCKIRSIDFCRAWTGTNAENMHVDIWD